MNMKIYLVKRTDSIGYDEYDSLVVYANDENDAILQTFVWTKYGWDTDISKLEVTYIWENENVSEWSIILWSFNAW